MSFFTSACWRAPSNRIDRRTLFEIVIDLIITRLLVDRTRSIRYDRQSQTTNIRNYKKVNNNNNRFFNYSKDYTPPDRTFWPLSFFNVKAVGTKRCTLYDQTLAGFTRGKLFADRIPGVFPLDVYWDIPKRWCRTRVRGEYLNNRTIYVLYISTSNFRCSPDFTKGAKHFTPGRRCARSTIYLSIIFFINYIFF